MSAPTTAQRYGGPLQKGQGVRDKRSGQIGCLAFTASPDALYVIVEWDQPYAAGAVESALSIEHLEIVPGRPRARCRAWIPGAHESWAIKCRACV